MRGYKARDGTEVLYILSLSPTVMTSPGTCLLLLMTTVIIHESSGNIFIGNPFGGPSQGPPQPQGQSQTVYQSQSGKQQLGQQQPQAGSNTGYCVSTGRIYCMIVDCFVIQKQSVSFLLSFLLPFLLSTGTGCTNPDACCTKTCRSAPGRHSRICCLPEGAICETDAKGSPGLGTCCGGTMCMPMAQDQFGSGNPEILVCQAMTQSG